MFGHHHVSVSEKIRYTILIISLIDYHNKNIAKRLLTSFTILISLAFAQNNVFLFSLKHFSAS